MKNLYEAGAPSAEAQRLETFDWPNQVSRSSKIRKPRDENSSRGILFTTFL